MYLYKMSSDLGHGIAKGVTASDKRADFRHAIAEISQAQYERAMQLYGEAEAPRDYIRVNNQYYVVGEEAEAFSMQRRSGAARYEPNYYGVMMMSMITRLYQPGSFSIQLNCGHPPEHVIYVDELEKALYGQWSVETRGKSYEIDINRVDTYDEPTGALMNVLLSPDGKSYQNPEIRDQRILVIDIGYGTTDTIVYENQQVNYGTVKTMPLGISQVVDNFTTQFRQRYKEQLRDVNALRADQVRNAIVTGQYSGGGRVWDCQQEAQQSKNILLNQVFQHVQSERGGAFSYDGILLGGGGSALVHDEIFDHLQNENMMLAADVELMHYAIVLGGEKLRRMFEMLGV